MSNLPELLRKTLALASRCGSDEDKRLAPLYRAELDKAAARIEPGEVDGAVLAVNFAQSAKEETT